MGRSLQTEMHYNTLHVVYVTSSDDIVVLFCGLFFQPQMKMLIMLFSSVDTSTIVAVCQPRMR